MEDLGWDGGAEVIDNPALWSNIYAPQHFFNYCTEVSTVAVPNQEIHRLSQPFVDNNNSKHSISATKVVEPAIVAPAPLWQHQNNVVHSLGTIAPAGHIGGGILAQDDTLNGIVSMKASLDSLDCLFSATNSNTDTSLEDDGGTSSPSVVLTENPRSFWSFGPTVAVSSAESERNNNISNDKAKVDKEGTTNINTKKRERTNNVDNHDGGFRLISEPDLPKQKRLRSGKSGYSLTSTTSSNISFQLQPSSPTSSIDQAEPDQEAIAQMKEMIYRAAAFRPVNLGPEVVEVPKRKNVKISSDPQTVAARQRRERISERIRVLQKLVPGGTKMDTASMLDEAANYLKFLRNQIKALENLGPKSHDNSSSSSTTPNCYTTSGLNLAFSSTPLSHSLLGPIQAHLPLLNIPYHYRPQF